MPLHISRSRITSNMMRMWEGKLGTREDAGANLSHQQNAVLVNNLKDCTSSGEADRVMRARNHMRDVNLEFLC